MTTNTSQNFEIWVEKNMRVEFRKKNVSRVQKKKLSRERENADQLCYQSISSLCSLQWEEVSIQSSASLATKDHRILQIFSSPLLDLSRTWRGSLIQLHMTIQNFCFGALTNTKGHLQLGHHDLWDLGCLEIGKFALSTLTLTATHRFNHQYPSREVKSQLAEVQITKPKHNL